MISEYTPIENAIRWLREESDKLQFGEISLKLVKHDGVIRRWEKSITVKEQTPGGAV